MDSNKNYKTLKNITMHFHGVARNIINPSHIPPTTNTSDPTPKDSDPDGTTTQLQWSLLSSLRNTMNTRLLFLLFFFFLYIKQAEVASLWPEFL